MDREVTSGLTPGIKELLTDRLTDLKRVPAACVKGSTAVK